MRVAALVADARCAESGTRSCRDASVCWRRPGVPTAGAALARAESIVGASTAPPEPAFVNVWNVDGAPPWATPGVCGAPATGCGPEPVRPCTSAAAIASPSTAGTATKTSGRDGRGTNARRGAGADASTRARNVSGARNVAPRSSSSNATRRASSASRGASPASSASRRTSIADIDLLLQVLQGSAQTGRARGLADPEHPRSARSIELEQDAQRHDLAFRRGKLAHRLLQRPGQTVHQLGGLREIARIGLLTPPPPRLGAEPVDRDRTRDAAEPGARRAAARIEAPPRAECLLEGLGCEILRR